MDWVHCNSCFLIPSASRGNKFHLTNCGHIYCEQCLTAGGTKKCKVCSTCNFNTIHLQSQMKPEVQEYFLNPDVMVNKLKAIMAFQAGHRTRITSYYCNMAKKYRAAKEEIHKQSEIIKKQKQEIKELKMKLALQGHKQISPISVGSARSNVAMNSSSNCLLMQRSPITPARPSFGSAQSSHNFWATPNRSAVHRPSPSNETSPVADQSPVSSPIAPLGFQLPEMYRANRSYASQSSTPETFSTPSGSPAYPESASQQHFDRANRYSSQNTTSLTPRAAFTPSGSPSYPESASQHHFDRLQNGSSRSHPKISPGSSTATLLNKLRLIPNTGRK